MDRHPVSIYGLGTLSLRQIAAQYGENRKTLLPPTMELHFEETSSTNSALIAWLKAKYKLNSNDAEKAVKMFSEKVLNTFLNTGSVLLPGVALFKRSEDNAVACEAESSMLKAFYQGFPEVSLEIPVIQGKTSETVPVATELVDEQVDQTENEDDNTTDEELPDESLVEILYSDDTLNPKQSIEEEEIPTESNPDHREEDSDMETFDLEDHVEDEAEKKKILFDLTNELDQMEEEDRFEKLLSEAYGQDDNKGKRLSNFWGTILIVFSIALACILMVDACKKYKRTDVKQTQEAAPVDLALGNAADSDAEKLLQAEASIQQDSCIIITGVFSSDRNIEMMSQSIASFGYTVYTEQRGIYTRVGLKFQCQNTDLESFIQTIRKDISPKAWYLDPELYVAYLD